MDPASLAVVMKELAPVLVALSFTLMPIGIIWLRHVHKIRMREMDLEEKMLPGTSRRGWRPSRTGWAASSAPLALRRDPLRERAGMLEGPASGGEAEAAPLVRGRER